MEFVVDDLYYPFPTDQATYHKIALQVVHSKPKHFQIKKGR